ncbi:ABC transporter substrate-binding protein [Paraferrimonas sedimenticola]|uniref:ABC transporter substrate-binding protein n=1 Tax=Paraferrimonas sedimenticola TaxID=375674 RepID=A0AA37VVG2_9GAMM|nr:ABC transporter substrate-binding protein [Paraferrimonas sedimenticola]GLP96041.1 ABC transporter substrate-binding protein [Paraferrimonas sedimenticola]
MHNAPDFSAKSSRKGLVAIVAGLVGVLGTTLYLLADGQHHDRPTKANTVSIAAAMEFTTQQPSQHGYIYSRMGVLETLLNVNEQGQLTPGLATDWQVSEDGKRWQFTLRPNVFFHDGSKMTAQAVAKSLQHAVDTHGPLAEAPIVRITAEGTDSVTVWLEQPYSPLGALIAHYSAGIVASGAFDKDGFVHQLIATGPYQVFEFEPPHKLVVERFDQYWKGPASIRFASYLTGHRSESRVLQAKSGQADIVFGLEPSSLPQIRNAKNVVLHTDPIPRAISIKLNAGLPQLKDDRVRQALHLAIDRKGIAESIFRTPGVETEQLLPAAFSDWYLTDLSSAADAKDKAAKLLDQAGWRMGAQGMREKDGQLLRLTMITYADRPELTIVATAIQSQWAEIGVDLGIDVVNSSGIPMGHQDQSLEVALMARNYGFIADPLATIIADFATKSDGSKGGDWGAMNWSSSKLDSLLGKLPLTSDRDEYRQMAQESAQIIHQSYSVLPVVTYTQQSAVNERIKGFSFDPFERSYRLEQLEIAQ